MKKLGKLQINPEKVMKNEELIALRGGYDGGQYIVYVRCGFAPDYTSSCFTVYYDDWNFASAIITQTCWPHGATFSGEGCPQ